MNKIYLEISKLSDKFRTMCYGLTQDKEEIDDAVIETGEVSPKKHLYNIPEEIVENIGFKKLDKIDAALGEMYWYDRKVFQLYYYEGNTLDTLAKKTGISRNSLFTTIDKVRTLLKAMLNE